MKREEVVNTLEKYSPNVIWKGRNKYKEPPLQNLEDIQFDNKKRHFRFFIPSCITLSSKEKVIETFKVSMYMNDYLLDDERDVPDEETDVSKHLVIDPIRRERELRENNMLIPGSEYVFDFLDKIENEDL